MCILEEEIYIYQQNIHFFNFRTKTQQKSHSMTLWQNLKTDVYLKCLSYSNYIYLQYNVFKDKQVKKYIWALYHKFFPILCKINSFQYLPEYEIEGTILGWALSNIEGPYTACTAALLDESLKITGFQMRIPRIFYTWIHA